MIETITTWIHNLAFTSIVNMPVFIAILLALVAYRVLAPLIDFFNPVIIVTNVGWTLRHAFGALIARAAIAVWHSAKRNLSGNIETTPANESR